MNKAKSLADFQLPRWQQLPSVPLYLEQVLALLEEWLGPSGKRGRNDSDKDDDQQLCKTAFYPAARPPQI